MTGPTPLAGIKVVEFTHMVMGPTVGHILAGLGAEVIRVEPIGGDQTRRLLGSGRPAARRATGRAGACRSAGAAD